MNIHSFQTRKTGRKLIQPLPTIKELAIESNQVTQRYLKTPQKSVESEESYDFDWNKFTKNKEFMFNLIETIGNFDLSFSDSE